MSYINIWYNVLLTSIEMNVYVTHAKNILKLCPNIDSSEIFPKSSPQGFQVDEIWQPRE